MDIILIETLEKVAGDLTAEAKQKREWGHLGNSFGRDECRKLLEFEAEILLAIAASI